MLNENIVYEVYCKAVACGDEYAGFTWEDILLDMYGEAEPELLAALNKQFPPAVKKRCKHCGCLFRTTTESELCGKHREESAANKEYNSSR